jgi:hypothetical protein
MHKKLLVGLFIISLFSFAKSDAFAGTAILSAEVDVLNLPGFSGGQLDSLLAEIRANRVTIGGLGAVQATHPNLFNLEAAIKRLESVLERRSGVILSISRAVTRTMDDNTSLVAIPITPAWHNGNVQVPYRYLKIFHEEIAKGATPRLALDYAESRNIGAGWNTIRAGGFFGALQNAPGKYVPATKGLGAYRTADNAKDEFARNLAAVALPDVQLAAFPTDPIVDAVAINPVLNTNDVELPSAPKNIAVLTGQVAKLNAVLIPNVKKLLAYLLDLRTEMLKHNENVWPQELKDALDNLANRMTEPQLTGDDGQTAIREIAAKSVGHFAAHVSTLSKLLGGAAGSGDYYTRAYDFYHRFYDLPSSYHRWADTEQNYYQDLARQQAALDAAILDRNQQRAALGRSAIDLAGMTANRDRESATLVVRTRELGDMRVDRDEWQRVYGDTNRLYGQTYADLGVAEADLALRTAQRDALDATYNRTKAYLGATQADFAATEASLIRKRDEAKAQAAKLHRIREETRNQKDALMIRNQKIADYNRMYGDTNRLYSQTYVALGATEAALGVIQAERDDYNRMYDYTRGYLGATEADLAARTGERDALDATYNRTKAYLGRLSTIASNREQRLDRLAVDTQRKDAALQSRKKEVKQYTRMYGKANRLYGQTYGDLGATEAALGVTQAERDDYSRMYDYTRGYLGVTEADLALTQAERDEWQRVYGYTRAFLGRTQADLANSTYRLGRTRAELGRQQAAITRRNERIGNYSRMYDYTRGYLGVVQADLVTTQGDLPARTGERDAVVGDLVARTGERDTALGDVAAKQAQIGLVTAERDRARLNIFDKATKIAALSDERDAAKAAATDKEEKLGTLTSAHTTLKTEHTATAAELKAAQATIAEQAATIANLTAAQKKLMEAAIKEMIAADPATKKQVAALEKEIDTGKLTAVQKTKAIDTINKAVIADTKKIKTAKGPQKGKLTKANAARRKLLAQLRKVK